MGALTVGAIAHAGFLEYGDEDVLGTDSYESDPKAGATLIGLAPNAFTHATLITPHGYPFDPMGDYPGTDQIYVGSVQTEQHDGYSAHDTRINGPQKISLNYASIVPAGHTILSLTLGIAADDFQFVPFGQPYAAKVNGVANSTMTDILNAFDQTGPRVQFFTIGINPVGLDPTHVLELEIDQLGDGGDGWAIDFLTIGVETRPVPEPSTLSALGVLGLAFVARKRLAR